MSFGVNGPTPPKGIQEAQNMKNNGGGGNLGYFQRGKQKKKKEDEIDVFTPSPDEDEFMREEEFPEAESENLLNKVAGKLRNLFKHQSTLN